MKFAPVLPAEVYPTLDSGDYHLVQAHLATPNTIDWLKACVALGHTVILDNGVIERGSPATTELLELAEEVNPQVIVVPDKFDDAEASLWLFRKWMSPCLLRAPQIMCVPHGSTPEDWLKCFLEMEAIYQATVDMDPTNLLVGVPKVLDKVPGLRQYALWLLEAVTDTDFERLHLLGIWNTPQEVARIAAKFPAIGGVDSTLPYALALEGALLVPESPKCTIAPADWNSRASLQTLRLAAENIRRMEAICTPNPSATQTAANAHTPNVP